MKAAIARGITENTLLEEERANVEGGQEVKVGTPSMLQAREMTREQQREDRNQGERVAV